MQKPRVKTFTTWQILRKIEQELGHDYPLQTGELQKKCTDPSRQSLLRVP